LKILLFEIIHQKEKEKRKQTKKSKNQTKQKAAHEMLVGKVSKHFVPREVGHITTINPQLLCTSFDQNQKEEPFNFNLSQSLNNLMGGGHNLAIRR
jgi:hypothetical protein